jgi:hypothetical protein
VRRHGRTWGSSPSANSVSGPRLRTAAWYRKAHAICSETMALGRQGLWGQGHVATSQAEADVEKIPCALFVRFREELS